MTMKHSSSPLASNDSGTQTLTIQCDAVDTSGQHDVGISECSSFISNGDLAEPSQEKVHAKFREEPEIILEINGHIRKPLIYNVSDTPPVHLLLLFAMQQCLLSIDTPLSVSVLVAEVVCARNDDIIKAQILSASMMMAGLATVLMTTIGVRLPIFQGPTPIYLINLAAMASLSDWKCPESIEATDPVTNTTMMFADLGNGTVIPQKDLILGKIGQLSGSLMLAGILHCLIGATGLVGILIRFIGPITIVPAIVLVGLNIYTVTVRFCQTSWTVAAITAGTSMFLSLFLSNCRTPIPWWSKRKGLHIFWFPLHQVFAILIGMVVGWAVSAIMTSAGAYSDDPKSGDYLARTDSRSHVIDQVDWLTFPYPGKFGHFSFSTGAFINFFLVTFLSVLDSIGDYSASARIAQVAPPPKYAFNRGVAVEGLMTILSGSMGCCHATVSHGGNIGAMGITGVVSRRVFQILGIIYILFSVMGKLGAVFITIPYSVLGGAQIVAIGIFIGVILSYLQSVDLNSTRNLAIIGISLLLGLMMPHWVKENPNAIDTGSSEVDTALKMLFSNPSFVGGAFACFMDNLMPGSLKERGLVAQIQQVENKETANGMSLPGGYKEGPEVYRLPFLPDAFRRSAFARYIPLFEYKKSK